MNAHEPFCAGFFATLNQADRAITNLIALGYPHDRLTVIVPEPFRDTLTQSISRTEPPTRHAPERIVQGALLGAAVGGVALAALLLTSNVFSILMGVMVFIGGGAMAGCFASLIVEEGYQTGIGEYYTQAMNNHQIVVGVQGDGPASDAQLFQAARILKSAGAVSLAPQEDPTKHPATESTNDGALPGI